MADLTIQKVVEAGLSASYANAAAGGDAVLNVTGDVVLHVQNGHTSSQTVTVPAQRTSQNVADFGELSKSNIQVAIPAGEDRFIGPFPKAAFNDGAGKVQITYSGVTSLTIAALQVPKAA